MGTRLKQNKRDESYRALVEQANNARKDLLPPASSIPFHGIEAAYLRALMAYHERKDIAPLLAFVRSDRFPRLLSSPAYLENHARLIELLHARGQPLEAGKPGGTHWRWQIPEYVAAFLIDKLIDTWKREHRKAKVPAKTKKEYVTAVLDFMKKHGKRAKEERVLTLLHEPKNRRL